MKTQITHPTYSIEITHELPFESLYIKPIEDFSKRLIAFNEKVPIQSFEFSIKEVPSIYDYSFKAKDGRNWTQTIDFSTPNENDPKMTFTLEDPWTQSEFSFHTPFRESVIALRNQYKVDKIECKYNGNA